jgi:lysophospholipase L1-like esterase
MSKAMWGDRLSTIAFGASICAIAASIVLGFSYENLRRKLAGISADLARLPTPTISREHTDARTFIIRSKLSRTSEPVVILGDSIVEASDPPASICGHAVVNAGIGGTTIGYFARNAELLLREVKPSLVVLAVGINDASSGGQADRTEPFREAYRTTLQSLPAVPVAVATITPIGPDASKILFDASLVDRFNDIIRQFAKAHTLVDLHKALTGNFTIDGIHLNGDGYKLWNAEIVAAVTRTLWCTESNNLSPPHSKEPTTR